MGDLVKRPTLNYFQLGHDLKVLRAEMGVLHEACAGCRACLIFLLPLCLSKQKPKNPDTDPPLHEHLGRNKYTNGNCANLQIKGQGSGCLPQVSSDVFREAREGFPAEVAHIESEK